MRPVLCGDLSSHETEVAFLFCRCSPLPLHTSRAKRKRKFFMFGQYREWHENTPEEE